MTSARVVTESDGRRHDHHGAWAAARGADGAQAGRYGARYSLTGRGRDRVEWPGGFGVAASWGKRSILEQHSVLWPPRIGRAYDAHNTALFSFRVDYGAYAFV